MRHYRFSEDFSEILLDINENIRDLIDEIADVKCTDKEEIIEGNQWTEALESQVKAINSLVIERLKDGE